MWRLFSSAIAASLYLGVRSSDLANTMNNSVLQWFTLKLVYKDYRSWTLFTLLIYVYIQSYKNLVLYILTRDFRAILVKFFGSSITSIKRLHLYKLLLTNQV